MRQHWGTWMLVRNMLLAEEIKERSSRRKWKFELLHGMYELVTMLVGQKEIIAKELQNRHRSAIGSTAHWIRADGR